MGTLSHAIAPSGLAVHHRTSHRFSPSSLRLLTTFEGVAKNSNHIFAQSKSQSRQQIDFSDPNWKSRFQMDFEKRFNIPHITDVFPDFVPIPSTFCLRMRRMTSADVRLASGARANTNPRPWRSGLLGLFRQPTLDFLPPAIRPYAKACPSSNCSR
ncbi:6-phosphofructokinase 5 [Pyrus ussuriensis x Pyrus communis]|uniref:6-phosphofructokinase 5 n=1 Tax=Pyrus ussuriensis x Pyrus communis TaxID=2448454 RepID=A0A5N5GFX6_9ROSA|nr:6-phosphofructokinase 5 [Pyrus ussuriensis x Pyrus communis]